MHTEISRPRKGSVTNGLSVYSSDFTRLDVYTSICQFSKAIKGRVSDRWTIPETSKFKKGINSTGLYAVNVQEELWIF